jgi:hypothetical protein
VTLYDNETFLSFDVTSLYTSVPIEQSIEIIKDLLASDTTLDTRTNLTPDEIVSGIGLCLHSTFFTFKQTLYRQSNGVAMGSPIAPTVANIFLGYLEQQIMSTFAHPPRVWWRYVDDTFVIVQRDFRNTLLDFINSFCSEVSFTCETESSQRSLSFLDCLVTSTGAQFHMSVFRKPTYSGR